jgi:hypothetical protein
MKKALKSLDRETSKYKAILTQVRDVILSDSPSGVYAPGSKDRMAACADRIYLMRHIQTEMNVLDRIRKELALYEELVEELKSKSVTSAQTKPKRK